jgi:hypothetical protein
MGGAINAWRRLVVVAKVRRTGGPNCGLTNAVCQLS